MTENCQPFEGSSKMKEKDESELFSFFNSKKTEKMQRAEKNIKKTKMNISEWFQKIRCPQNKEKGLF